MSERSGSETRTEFVKFVFLMTTFIAASLLMALRLPS